MHWSFTNNFTTNTWDDHTVFYYPASSVTETIVYRTSRLVTYSNEATWSAINNKPISQRFKCSYIFNTLKPYVDDLREAIVDVNTSRYPVLLPDYACSTDDCYVSSRTLIIPNSSAFGVVQPWAITSPCLLVTPNNSYAVELTNINTGNDRSFSRITKTTQPDIEKCIYYPLREATVLGASNVRSRHYDATLECEWEMKIPRVYHPTRGRDNLTIAEHFPKPKDVIQMATSLPDSTFADRKVNLQVVVPNIMNQEQYLTYSASYNDSLNRSNREDYLLKAVHAKHMQSADKMTLPTEEPNESAECIPSDDSLVVSYRPFEYNCQFSYRKHG